MSPMTRPFSASRALAEQRERTRLARRVQTELNALGYDAGRADGKPGDQTENAVIAFQRREGLPQTKRIDRALLASLERVAARNRSHETERTETVVAARPDSRERGEETRVEAPAPGFDPSLDEPTVSEEVETASLDPKADTLGTGDETLPDGEQLAMPIVETSAPEAIPPLDPTALSVLGERALIHLAASEWSDREEGKAARAVADRDGAPIVLSPDERTAMAFCIIQRDTRDAATLWRLLTSDAHCGVYLAALLRTGHYADAEHAALVFKTLDGVLPPAAVPVTATPSTDVPAPAAAEPASAGDATVGEEQVGEGPAEAAANVEAGRRTVDTINAASAAAGSE